MKIRQHSRSAFANFVSSLVSLSLEYLYTSRNQHNALLCRGQTFTEIPVIRIAEYINDVVAKRKVPANRNGSVIMKIDVEVRTNKFQLM